MIRIAIVEDDRKCAEGLQAYLYRFRKEKKYEKFELTIFDDGEDILAGYKNGFDIILMDIEMQFMDGLTAAEKIRQMDEKVIIIFVTNSAQYAVSGYSVNALDYVLKPVSYFAFSQRMEKAVKRLKKDENKFITIVFKGGIRKLAFTDICWIESRGHRLTFHTRDGEYETTCCSLREIEEKLEDTSFFRCNQGYLLNLAFIEGIEDGYALIGKQKLMISRSRKREFMLALTTHLGENL